MQLTGSGNADAAGQGTYFENHCSRAIRKESGVLQTQGHPEMEVRCQVDHLSWGRRAPASSQAAERPPCCFTKTHLVGKVLMLTNPASCTFHSGVPWCSQTDELCSLLQEVLFLLQSATAASRVLSLNRQTAFPRPFVAGFPSTFLMLGALH